MKRSSRKRTDSRFVVAKFSEKLFTFHNFNSAWAKIVKYESATAVSAKDLYVYIHQEGHFFKDSFHGHWQSKWSITPRRFVTLPPSELGILEFAFLQLVVKKSFFQANLTIYPVQCSGDILYERLDLYNNSTMTSKLLCWNSKYYNQLLWPATWAV